LTLDFKADWERKIPPSPGFPDTILLSQDWARMRTPEGIPSRDGIMNRYVMISIYRNCKTKGRAWSNIEAVHPIDQQHQPTLFAHLLFLFRKDICPAATWALALSMAGSYPMFWRFRWFHFFSFSARAS